MTIGDKWKLWRASQGYFDASRSKHFTIKDAEAQDLKTLRAVNLAREYERRLAEGRVRPRKAVAFYVDEQVTPYRWRRRTRSAFASHADAQAFVDMLKAEHGSNVPVLRIVQVNPPRLK
jgi:hypothetical protein